MYENKLDLLKSRMHLKIEGNPDVAEIQAWSDDLIAKLKRLKPGFGVISEISKCNPATEEGRQPGLSR